MSRCAGIAVFLFVAALLVDPTGAAEPVEFEQVLELVAAGVGDGIILKQVAAGGPAFGVSIPEVLALKEAGASDELIDNLMELAGVGEPAPASPSEAAASPASSESPEPEFRIYKEVDDNGHQVIHITNLDSSGRRIGGPAPESQPAPRNAYVSREEDTYTGGEYGPSSGVPPVIVNVFIPENEPVVVREPSPDPYGTRYARGILPGYYGRGSYGRYGYGYRGRHSFGVPSPPGSYSHYKRYHSQGLGTHAGLYNGGLIYRAVNQRSYALPVPFRSAGASQLNRMRANVRLGH